MIGMLEVILSDFARLEAETSTAEEQAQTEYDQFMDDSAIDKAQRKTDIEHKTMKKQNEEQALTERKPPSGPTRGCWPRSPAACRRTRSRR